VAGQIIVSSIKTDSDNSISFVSNTGATIFSANLASGLSIDSFGNNTITSDKIVSVANTKISGNIVSSQITSVANTQLTGTVTSAQVGSSVYEGMGMRNRIINGDMRIDQRNAGAAVTTHQAFPVDRFLVTNTTDGAFSAQQDSSAPTGFNNSVKYTTTTADASLTGTQQSVLRQRIEGFNVADLAWGTANAKTVTLSFWVRSSLTGTFGGVIGNNASDRSYPFTYTISVADTWEYKTVTIAGDTTGTWLTTNGIGINVHFGLGAGPDRSGTAGAWAGAQYVSATGAVSVIGTLNATWYITGVQLEVGSVATPFERRPYGTELSLCQRYYQLIDNGVGKAPGGAIIQFNATLVCEMRATPSISGTTLRCTNVVTADFTNTSPTFKLENTNVRGGRFEVSGWSGLTTGDVYILLGTGTSAAPVRYSAEL
jgi:hypothetical protein